MSASCDKPVLVVDLDGVLCMDTGRWDDYGIRAPRPGSVRKLRELAEDYRIIIHTARRSSDAFWVTVQWFTEHDLDSCVESVVFDKPRGLVYVDDRAVSDLRYVR